MFKAEGRSREYLAIGISRDRDTLVAHSKDPDTDRWYRRRRATLEAGREWNKGSCMEPQQRRGCAIIRAGVICVV